MFLLGIFFIIHPAKLIALDHPTIETQEQITPQPEPEVKIEAKPELPKVKGTLIKTDVKISEEALQDWLGDSPLAPHAAKILESDYWSTIIGICAIEQYRCQRAPSWNFWGIMKPGGGLQRYKSAEEGIQAIHNFLENKAWNRGRLTLEKFRGWYCVNKKFPGNVCPEWEPHVKKIKAEIESYEIKNQPNDT